jgi:hypothetical protein
VKKSPRIVAIVLSTAIVLTTILIPTVSPQTRNAISPDLLKKGVDCLVAQTWGQDALENLGLKIGSRAAIRYRLGNIPGTSPPSPDRVNVIVYSHGQKKGWMFFLKLEGNGRVSAIMNGYTLERAGQHWSAGEGNGGMATYLAIGAYATEIAKQRPIYLIIEKQQTGCDAED